MLRTAPASPRKLSKPPSAKRSDRAPPPGSPPLRQRFLSLQSSLPNPRLPFRLFSGGRLEPAGFPAPRLLALHGFTGSGEDFECLADDPATPFAWFAPDLPGHGPTLPGPALPPDLASCLQIADAIASALAPIPTGLAPTPTAPSFLLGYSLGGRLALHLALARPGRFAGLILIGASPGLASPAERAERCRHDAALAARLRAEGLEPFLAFWQQQPLLRSQAAIPQPWRARLLARRRLHDPSALAAALEGLGAGALPPLWESLPSLRLPVLLVTGEEDAKFTALARDMAPLLPHARHDVIPAAGHAPHLEQPAAFARLLPPWLAQS